MMLKFALSWKFCNWKTTRNSGKILFGSINTLFLNRLDHRSLEVQSVCGWSGGQDTHDLLCGPQQIEYVALYGLVPLFILGWEVKCLLCTSVWPRIGLVSTENIRGWNACSWGLANPVLLRKTSLSLPDVAPGPLAAFWGNNKLKSAEAEGTLRSMPSLELPQKRSQRVKINV